MRYKDNGKFNRIYGKTLLGAHVIHGQSIWAEARLVSRNPANPGDQVAVFPEAGPAELEQARLSAEQAWSVWQNTPSAERREILWRLALLLEVQQEKLAHLITRELGIVWAQSLAQIHGLIVQLKRGDAQGGTVPEDISDKQAVGVFGASGAKGANKWPTAAASFFTLLQVLFQGRPLIWLAWQEAPALAYTLASLCLQAGMPPGCLNCLVGGEELFSALQQGLATGRYRDLDNLLTVVEKSLHPQIVMRETPLAQAVSTALEGLSQQLGGGMWPVVIQASVEDAFKRLLLRQFQTYRLGDPCLDHCVKTGPLSHQAAMGRFLQHLQVGKSQGAHLLSGKGRLTRENKPENFVGDPDAGYYVWPAVWQQLTPEMNGFFQSVYGPCLGLFRVVDMEQAQAWSQILTSGSGHHTAFALS